MDKPDVTTDIAHISLRPEGFIYIKLLPNAIVTLADVKQLTKSIWQLTGGANTPALADIRYVKSADHEARVYGASTEAHAATQAVALLVNSSMSRVIGNFYLNFSKPPVPTRLFTSETEAIAWLMPFCLRNNNE